MRKVGWDTHGLPVELQVEKELGFSGKKYVLARYNDSGNYTYNNCRFITQRENMAEQKPSPKNTEQRSNRIKIINELRSDEFDVLIGINLLREGLDLPEVKLVAILDADKEGFLRSATSLIQIVGRAARNSESKVIMYADRITDSMKKAIDETNYRREKQMKYNTEHNVKPMTIKKDIVDSLKIRMDDKTEKLSKQDITKKIEQLKGMMNTAASQLDFETAIRLREEIANLKKQLR